MAYIFALAGKVSGCYQNFISHNAPVHQRMLTGFEHLPHSPLPTLMLAKMVVRA